MILTLALAFACFFLAFSALFGAAPGLARKIPSAAAIPRPALWGALFFITFFAVTRDPVISLPAFFPGWLLPGIIRRISLNRRKTALEEQLCDSLFSISSSLKAGSGIIQALENAAAESKPPFSEGVRDVLAKTKMGMPMRDALDTFDKKEDVRELHLAVTAINAAFDYGGNLSENLFRIALTIKERKKIRDKMRAATAQGRMSAMTITLMPFLLAAVLGIMEPAIFGALIMTGYGKLILLAAVLMTLTGNYFIMRIVRIK